jgi:hypothetical protein
LGTGLIAQQLPEAERHQVAVPAVSNLTLDLTANSDNAMGKLPGLRPTLALVVVGPARASHGT